jgi:L-asparagine transporter-like permease
MGTPTGKLPWWQLTLFGVGCTIGTGFFLDSSIAIRKSGLLVLVIFVLAAVATLFVYEALAQMTMQDPQKVLSVVMLRRLLDVGPDLSWVGSIGVQKF